MYTLSRPSLKVSDVISLSVFVIRDFKPASLLGPLFMLDHVSLEQDSE